MAADVSLNRRKLLLGGGIIAGSAALIGIGDLIDKRRMNRHATGIPPWHMWGNSQSVTLTGDPSTGTTAVGGQIARINYKRPDTWNFFLGAKVTAFNYLGGAVPSLDINFSLTLGVGLSLFTIDVFEHLHWDLPTDLAIERYVTEVQGPSRGGGSTVENLIRDLPAQSINCNFNATLFVPAGAPAQVVVEVSGFFAPKTHIRPDWFVQKFDGEELGGR